MAKTEQISLRKILNEAVKGQKERRRKEVLWWEWRKVSRNLKEGSEMNKAWLNFVRDILEKEQKRKEKPIGQNNICLSEEMSKSLVGSKGQGDSGQMDFMELYLQKKVELNKADALMLRQFVAIYNEILLAYHGIPFSESILSAETLQMYLEYTGGNLDDMVKINDSSYQYSDWHIADIVPEDEDDFVPFRDYGFNPFSIARLNEKLSNG